MNGPIIPVVVIPMAIAIVGALTGGKTTEPAALAVMAGAMFVLTVNLLPREGLISPEIRWNGAAALAAAAVTSVVDLFALVWADGWVTP